MSTIHPGTTYRKIILTAVYLLIFPVLMLWLSVDWLWIEGWLLVDSEKLVKNTY